MNQWIRIGKPVKRVLEIERGDDKEAIGVVDLVLLMPVIGLGDEAADEQGIFPAKEDGHDLRQALRWTAEDGRKGGMRLDKGEIEDGEPVNPLTVTMPDGSIERWWFSLRLNGLKDESPSISRENIK